MKKIKPKNHSPSAHTTSCRNTLLSQKQQIRAKRSVLSSIMLVYMLLRPSPSLSATLQLIHHSLPQMLRLVSVASDGG